MFGNATRRCANEVFLDAYVSLVRVWNPRETGSSAGSRTCLRSYRHRIRQLKLGIRVLASVLDPPDFIAVSTGWDGRRPWRRPYPASKRHQKNPVRQRRLCARRSFTYGREATPSRSPSRPDRGVGRPMGALASRSGNHGIWDQTESRPSHHRAHSRPNFPQHHDTARTSATARRIPICTQSSPPRTSHSRRVLPWLLDALQYPHDILWSRGHR